MENEVLGDPVKKKILLSYDKVVWDFDGVIKDSVAIKGECYVEVFCCVPKGLRDKIRSHHMQNGGLSRFKKIPLYMDWLKIDLDLTQQYLQQFSKLTISRVLSSNDIIGVRDCIETRFNLGRLNIISSATPTIELKEILASLSLDKYVQRANGAESKKSAVLFDEKSIMTENQTILMVGDSKHDYLAALEAKVDFLFRGHCIDYITFREFSEQFGHKHVLGYFERLD